MAESIRMWYDIEVGLLSFKLLFLAKETAYEDYII